MSKEQAHNPAEEEQVLDTSDVDVNQQEVSDVADNQTDTAGDDPVKLQASLAELQDKHLRLMAEFDNFRRRTQREKLDLMATAAKDTMSVLLPVLDDFDRFQNLSDEVKATTAYSEGIALVYHKLFTALKNKGLEVLETKGIAFDPDSHEAITEIPAPSEDLKGKVIDTIERGYTLNGKLIRFAKVVVGA